MRLTKAETDCLLHGKAPTEAEVDEAMKQVIGLPYPNPETWEQVHANRVAALNSGAMQHHYIPAVMPTPAIWQETLERLAACENAIDQLFALLAKK